ncbi:MAG TPA: histidine kinase [Kofleriaceae bacterium]
MQPNDGPDGLARGYLRARWGLIAIAWGAIFLFDASRHCIDAYLAGRPPSTRWLMVSGASLALWAAVTPFMLWLGRRAPLDREGRARSVATHVAALLAILMIDAALQGWLWSDYSKSTFRSLFFALMIIDGFSYATVIAIGHVQRSNALYRERVRAQAALDRELTTARLRALEMQLQPHFLFNTLHAVGALVRSARPDDAVRSLATLGGLLRATLAGDEHEIALDDEIALAHRYLALQKIRFAERLQVDVAIAPGVERARVPRLILQPLLENAIRHGVEHSRTAVAVEVRACARGGRLELIVRDHGGTREGRSPGQGIGLANTRARLATLYGKAHDLALTPTEGGGLAIRIEIPLVLAPDRAAAPQELELDGELADELGAIS